MISTSTNKPKAVDGWNVAELAGGLLLSAEGFTVQLSTVQVDRLLQILNSGGSGTVRDSNGDVIKVSSPARDHVVLVRVNDSTYPYGIILPVNAFSEVEDAETPVIEGMRPAFRRVGSKIKRGFRIKPKGTPEVELKRKLVRALKTELPGTETPVVRKLNHNVRP